MSFGNILVIDNDETAQFILSRVMHRMKRTEKLTFAKNGERALQLMEEQDFSLVLLDLHQPFLNGFEFLQALSHRHELTGQAPPRIVILSSSDSRNAHIRAKAEYLHIVSDHLAKPFKEEHVLRLLGAEQELS